MYTQTHNLEQPAARTPCLNVSDDPDPSPDTTDENDIEVKDRQLTNYDQAMHDAKHDTKMREELLWLDFIATLGPH